MAGSLNMCIAMNERVANFVMIVCDNDGQRTMNVIDISRSKCVPRCPNANHIVTIANSLHTNISIRRLDCNGTNTCVEWLLQKRLCSIVRLSMHDDVQLLNSVRTKFICKNFLFSFNSPDFTSTPSDSICEHNRICVDWHWCRTQSSPRIRIEWEKRSSIYNKHVVHICMTLCVVALLVTSLFWLISTRETIFICVCETEWVTECGHIHSESNLFCIQSYCVVVFFLSCLFCLASRLVWCSKCVPAIKLKRSVRILRRRRCIHIYIPYAVWDDNV